ncbi:TPA: GNAT family N-acetyltransferase [Bacillus thuringiensis]|uniref:GNAT family N-acetyltransferase n=1 Tax=Bacillus thuringiensis serovar iberica TaxID=180866 RepID=A0A9X6LR30_BACTU|nr:GNAT family N-acetyltransferase [Bacillus thuringiensis]MEB9625929.1 GNAT family N-acetyltransferase [Bacillus cereus]OUB52991.1 GNAT family N-acetyltransferase [Bacillus thuringiensis serovar iberica]HDR5354194.1 GNAT family N-acetyltransferase [Bacillus thuringiensis]
MERSLTIESLQEEHLDVIQQFVCEDESEVEEFLKEKAMIYHLRNMARTRLFFDEDHNLVGYFTVFNDHVCLGRSKRQKAKIVSPQGENHFPAIRLHYLGVDDRYRGRRYGEEILISALVHAYKLSRITGCTLLTVQALSSSVGFYKKYDFKIWKNEFPRYTDMFFAIQELNGILEEDHEKEFLNKFV